MRSFLSLLALVVVAAPVAAKPPASPWYQRMDGLRASLATRFAELKEQEEFEAKPLQEKLVLLLERNDPNVKRFERIELTPERVAREVFDWDEVETKTPTEAGLRTCQKLVQVLTERYAGKNVVPGDVDKHERYEVSRVLVRELTSDYLHVRVTAIEALKGIYRERDGRLYKPDASERDRREKARNWQKYIVKQRR